MSAALRASALLVALVAGMEAAAQPAEDLFSRLDGNGDGYLGRDELQGAGTRQGGWIAIDRDGDERFSRAEFEVVGQAAVPDPKVTVDVVDGERAQLRNGISARRLVGAEVVEPDGAPAGTVRDILVNAAGAVTGLVVDRGLYQNAFRLPWHEARVVPEAGQVVVPAASASAGLSGAAQPPLPLAGEWRATQFFDDVVQLERGKRYADVKDLIVAPWGEVRAIVVEDEPGGFYSYPWQSARFEPPYERTHIRNLRPFDYGALNIAAP